jgi:hypothetical protein
MKIFHVEVAIIVESYKVLAELLKRKVMLEYFLAL